MEIQSLTISESILLAEALWDSIIAEQAKTELTEARKEKLDQRLAAVEIDQGEGPSWSIVKALILDPGELTGRVRGVRERGFVEAIAQGLMDAREGNTISLKEARDHLAC